MAKSLIDFILPEDYDRYNELLGMAEEAKKNAPKAPRAFFKAIISSIFSFLFFSFPNKQAAH